MRSDIKELTLEDLKEVLISWNEPAFRAEQIFSWIYRKGALSFDKMSNLPTKLKQRLNENFTIFPFELEAARESIDGTKKFLFKLEDKQFIEAVSIPTEKRLTGCVSSQAGCKFACAFCASGVLGFQRNLSCAEILSQVLGLKNNSVQPLTHIVFMGTGEPLDNYDNLLKAVRIINSDYAFNIGARRITISTCGIIPGIKKLAEEGLQVELSVSLHSADNLVRDKLMPVNKKYPLKDLMPALFRYVEATNRQVTFEYMLAKGVNSDLPSALKLGKITNGLNCKVNLIPVNPQSECGFTPPDRDSVLFFRDVLIKAGILVTVRRSRGQDIEAACGQLRLRYENE